jgi:hypothetical protein
MQRYPKAYTKKQFPGISYRLVFRGGCTLKKITLTSLTKIDKTAILAIFEPCLAIKIIFSLFYFSKSEVHIMGII